MSGPAPELLRNTRVQIADRRADSASGHTHQTIAAGAAPWSNEGQILIIDPAL